MFFGLAKVVFAVSDLLTPHPSKSPGPFLPIAGGFLVSQLTATTVRGSGNRFLPVAKIYEGFLARRRSK
jgi:hypothetical protein